MSDTERHIYWCIIAILWICNGYAIYTWQFLWVAYSKDEATAAEFGRNKINRVIAYVLGPIISLSGLLGLLG